MPTPPSPLQEQAAPETAGQTRACPQCGSVDIRESTTRRGTDLLLPNINKEAYRCRGCRNRFYLKSVPDPSGASKAAAARRRKADVNRQPLWKHPLLKRHFNDISIGLGSLVAFGIFLYLLARSGLAI